MRRAPVRFFFNFAASSSSSCSGLFGVPYLHAPQDFSHLAREAVKQARKDINHLKTSKVRVVRGLDDISNDLCGVADAAELCRNVHPDDLWVEHANDAVTMVAEFMNEVNLDRDIFLLLRSAPDEDNKELAAVQKHMRESMEHEGVGLAHEQKERCKYLLEREIALSFQLSNPPSEPDIWVPTNVLTEVQPDSYRRFRTRGTTCTEVLVDLPFADAISRRVGNPDARRIVYEGLQQEDPERRKMLLELLQTRQELAQIRGYRDWNAYAQRDSILDGHAGVFLDDAWRSLEPKVNEEMNILEQFKKKAIGAGGLDPWDIPFLLHNANQEEAPDPRLTYQQLLQGVQLICSKMLGVEFVCEENKEHATWHPTVQLFTLRDSSGILGKLYLDAFVRPGKKMAQSAQFTLRGSKSVDGTRQIPSTALVLSIANATQPLPTQVAVTFMHEIGHALHSLLSCTELQHLSGTRGTVDFVEFPSHLFEFFASDPDAIAQYATPPTRPKVAFPHIEVSQQLFLAQVDYQFYATPNTALSDVSHVYDHVLTNLSPVAKLFTSPTLTKFEHLVYYGGSYYCYLLNKAMSAHVWQESFAGDPFAPDAGKRLASFFRNGSTKQHLSELERLLPDTAPRIQRSTSGIRISLDALMNQLGSSLNV